MRLFVSKWDYLFQNGIFVSKIFHLFQNDLIYFKIRLFASNNIFVSKWYYLFQMKNFYLVKIFVSKCASNTLRDIICFKIISSVSNMILFQKKKFLPLENFPFQNVLPAPSGILFASKWSYWFQKNLPLEKFPFISKCASSTLRDLICFKMISFVSKWYRLFLNNIVCF